MKETTRKLTYTASCVAIGLIGVAVARYTTANLVPLALTALCLYICLCRCGIVYGLVGMSATVALAFLICNLSASFFFLVVIFVPYSLAAYFMRGLTYSKPIEAVVRLVVSLAVFVAAFTALAFMLDFIAGTMITTIIEKIGVVWAGVLVCLVALPVDLLFSHFAAKVLKMLK